MADIIEEPRLDIHDLFVFLERWRRRNEHDRRTEIRWLAGKVGILAATALSIKSAATSHSKTNKRSGIFGVGNWSQKSVALKNRWPTRLKSLTN